LQKVDFEALFTDLIQQKLPLYRSIAVKIVNSAADADDAVQAALVKGWQRRNSFRSNSAALSGWLARIVVSESYDILRRRMRDGKKLAEYNGNDDDPAENPALFKLDAAIAELPELYRETVNIAVLSELSMEEAARVLNCAVNTLYQRIHKAKSLLKAKMRMVENE